MTFTETEQAACEHLIDLALTEDWHDVGDLTCAAIIPPDLDGQAEFVARVPGIAAGLAVAPLIYARASGVVFEPLLEDGAALERGTKLARVHGRMAGILTTERVVLNFLQRLSGIATHTHQYIHMVRDLPCQVLDTRKTTPGWRLLEKYAVRCGGGHNHRMGLYDGIMLKDNHLAALARSGGQGTITEAVGIVRQKYAMTHPVEVEVDTLEQLDEALACAPDIILLDNMTPGQLRDAVERRNHVAPKILLEASGGVSFQSLRRIAETGVDRVSIGALTHSAPALDIGLDYVR